MQNNNNHKSDSVCAFGETLIAILYGEANARENEDFELHLKQCRECRDEFSAFVTLRNAVSEWREIEFAPLVSPQIVLPGEIQTIEEATGKHSLLQSVRAFFSPAHFGWKTAAAGFAAFVILGLFLIGSTSLFRPPVEEAKSTIPTLNSTPEIATVPTLDSERKNITVEQDKPSITSIRSQEKMRISTRINSKAPKKSGVSATQNQNVPKRRNPVQKIEPKVDELNILPVADSDDYSPRLTDLLEEIEPSS